MANTLEEKNSRHTPKTATHRPTFPADPQKKSRLFQHFPQELRDKIYSHIFLSIRLTYGQRAVDRIDRMKIKPQSIVVILQTCRRTNQEIGKTWIGQVSFSFENPETMLDVLTALPAGTLSKLRHLRVPGNTLMLSYEDDDVYYRLASTLRLLPCLRLDTLTVLGTPPIEVSYDTLNGLISESCGWKELRYISHSSEVLGFARLGLLHSDDEAEKYTYWRKPQPAHWQSVLEGRDGVLSRPSIAIYRSTVSGRPGSAMNAKTGERFQQKIPEHIGTLEAFGITEDAGLVADGERDKEMIFIIKRGAGVDYEQKIDSPFIESDIRRDMPGNSWKEIRYECIDHIVANDDDLLLGYNEEDDEFAEIDPYEDVNYYVWPPLYHFMTEW
ncbi:hypothetical protein FOQG_19270 [Fusarium oxysporum f. sp. raphani 54005]|uniref:F-box domain-containing protein n=3 Tax=Fusarium oxysporum TaxID=5507 RepID=X0BBT1_FUSOX|nr:hypothetical protein FOQG_19270 [Fusarium oxysporum f. sp. raphani 54005]KAF6515421.1 hypothetical protein HZS61_005327 [Fusarium oxysporum f. sp. conglutinans]KAG6980108.1 hypothetical protein FocnCong_v009776 [Fusarium oxysporum f. sp. conglutinans]KAG7406847.1 hypothetical protein Forpi1262_v018213 [Fusarium oxysporum f. sp. raphani]KAI8401772.1 hypothetical protein FOFC_18641 [Fusarium oxysporum]